MHVECVVGYYQPASQPGRKEKKKEKEVEKEEEEAAPVTTLGLATMTTNASSCTDAAREVRESVTVCTLGTVYHTYIHLQTRPCRSLVYHIVS